MINNRRNFLKNASLAATGLGFKSIVSTIPNPVESKLGNNSRSVCIASITQHSLRGNTMHEVISAALKEMEIPLPNSPDIFCLPEIFHIAGIEDKQPSLRLSAEDGSGNLIAPFQSFAKKHNCYIICPVHSLNNGKYYNAAIVINRQGAKIGEYRKIRITDNEMKIGLTPGPLDPPVFQTDFGLIGIQTCYDIEWEDGWKKLSKKGAEIVFWPSAFSGGKKVNAKAWENQYYVVSSTQKGTSKIVDLLGDDIVTSGLYNSWGVCARVNLEKAFIHSYPGAFSFIDIQKKYGNKVNCYTLHDEEFSIIESLSPEVKVLEILKEFGLITYREQLKRDEDNQLKLRD